MPTIKVCAVCFNKVLEPIRLMRHIRWCPCISVVQEVTYKVEVEGPRRAPCQLKKTFYSVQDRDERVTERNEIEQFYWFAGSLICLPGKAEMFYAKAN